MVIVVTTGLIYGVYITSAHTFVCMYACLFQCTYVYMQCMHLYMQCMYVNMHACSDNMTRIM